MVDKYYNLSSQFVEDNLLIISISSQDTNIYSQPINDVVRVEEENNYRDDSMTDDDIDDNNNTNISFQHINYHWKPNKYINGCNTVYRKRIVKNFIIKKRNIKDLIIKDKLILSDNKYILQKNLLNNNSSSNLYAIQNVRKLINLKIINDFNISTINIENKEFILCSLKLLLKHYVIYHIKWLKEIDLKNNYDLLQDKDKEILNLLKSPQTNTTLQQTTNKIYIHLNLDRTLTVGENRIVFALSPINLKNFGNYMTKTEVCLLAMWFGGEEDFKYLCNIFKKEIKEILTDGIILNNIKFIFDFFITMDWAAINKISNIRKNDFCFYCKTLNPYCSYKHMKRTCEELSLLLGLPPSKIIPCLLHLKENVVKFFIDIILNNSIKPQKEIINLLKQIPSFKYITINNDKALTSNDVTDIYLIGKQCDNFFNYYKIFRGFIDDEDFLLIEKFTEIYNLLNIPNQLKDTDIKKIEEKILFFEKLYIKKYSVNFSKCWYLHILNYHVVDILHLYLSIKIFENQNFEVVYIDDANFLEMINKNGGRQRNYLKIYFPTLINLKLLQCLLFKLRLLYMAIYFDFCNDYDLCNNKIEDILIKKNYRKSRIFIFLNEPYVNFKDDINLINNLQNSKNIITIDTHNCDNYIKYYLDNQLYDLKDVIAEIFNPKAELSISNMLSQAFCVFK